MATSVVKVQSAALDEAKDGKIILRGVIDPETLVNLLTDDYQREAQPVSSLSDILEALKAGESLPDIELGMRGEKFREDDSRGNTVVSLQGEVYIIDGLQRVTAARHHMLKHPGIPVRIGATIHFNTNKEWERERFRVLNLLRRKVSTNILLRNKRESSRAVDMLYRLSTTDKTFVMNEKVSWAQNMNRSEMISALTLVKITGLLHSHLVPNRGTSMEDVVRGLNKAVETVGIQSIKANVKTFFDLIDECFGIRSVKYKDSAVHIRSAFLLMMARILSDHKTFWQDDQEKELFVDKPLRSKLSKFPVTDPTVITLVGSSGPSDKMLYTLIVDHINSGKRSKRLSSRYGNGGSSLGVVDEEKVLQVQEA